jgi:hypothetical protein
LEAVSGEIRQPSAVIDVSMRQHYATQVTNRNRKIQIFPPRLRAPSLKQSEVERDLLRADAEQMTRAGHFLRRTREFNVHWQPRAESGFGSSGE